MPTHMQRASSFATALPSDCGAPSRQELGRLGFRGVVKPPSSGSSRKIDGDAHAYRAGEAEAGSRETFEWIGKRVLFKMELVFLQVNERAESQRRNVLSGKLLKLGKLRANNSGQITDDQQRPVEPATQFV